MKIFAASFFAVVLCFPPDCPASENLPLFDFSAGSLDGWKMEGDAFGIADAHSPGKKIPGSPDQAYLSSGINGPQGKGAALSPGFLIERNYLNFLVAGARTWPDELGLALIVDGKVVRSSAGRAASSRSVTDFCSGTWDVREFQGKQAQLRAVDRLDGAGIYLDQVCESDERTTIASDATARFQETLRPRFHYSPPTGRLNDPNGCYFYNGLWHLMYQRTDWDHPRTTWGEAVSKDLIHWEERKAPLPRSNPDDSYASGGAVVDLANASGLKTGQHPPVFVCYTRVPSNPTKSNDPKYQMTPNLGCSLDGGETWQLWKGNPLWIPEFNKDRDGMPFFYAPTNEWFLVAHLSHNNEREKSVFGIFKAKANLEGWKLIQSISVTPPFWECPDMFELPVDGDARNRRWVLTEGRGDYQVGTFDGKEFKPELPGKVMTHYGGQFYAAQTFKNGKEGRVVQIAWMNAGKPDSGSYPGMPFINQMSFPTDLSLRTTPVGLRLFWWPAKEIESIRGPRLARTNISVGSTPQVLEGTGADLLDLRIVAEPRSAAQLIIRVHGQSLIYDSAKQELSGKRSPQPETAYLGWDQSTRGEKIERSGAIPVPLQAGRIDFRILVDRTSMDVYLNGGASHFIFNIWPEPSQKGVELSATGGEANIVAAEAYVLRP